MVEKSVPKIEIDYLTRRAKSVKTTDPSYVSKHARPCYELNQSMNPKGTTEKSLTKEQQEIYAQEFERERLRNEGRQRRQKKKEQKNKPSVSQLNGRNNYEK